MARKNYDSNTKWEPLIGYSRAVKVGDTIRVSGTTATDATGDVVGPGDPYAQTAQAISNIEAALKELGGKIHHVVRTRIYVVNIQDWPEVGRAHAHAWVAGHPACGLCLRFRVRGWDYRLFLGPGLLPGLTREWPCPVRHSPWLRPRLLQGVRLTSPHPSVELAATCSVPLPTPAGVPRILHGILRRGEEGSVG